MFIPKNFKPFHLSLGERVPIKFDLKFLVTREKHHFHLVDISPLPLIAAFASMLIVMNIVYYLHPSDSRVVHVFDNAFFQSAWLAFGIVLFAWFATVTKEAARGYHTMTVRKSLTYGMMLFIVSEVMFFFAFFWAFFHVSLSPSMAVGGVWPPKSLQSLDVWGLPLINTLLLLSSGVTITLAHRALLQATTYTWLEKFLKHLLVTIILGLTFLCCQGIEYKYGVTFRWKENVYGSTFFATTGFHGFHVTLGTIFLLFCLTRAVFTASRFWRSRLFLRLVQSFNYWNPYNSQDIELLLFSLEFNPYLRAYCELWPDNPFMYRAPRKLTRYWELREYVQEFEIWRWERILSKYALTKDQHFGFEASAWYWHFVDVVWIFLFVTVYWWGN